jgi:hypothetical protein
MIFFDYIWFRIAKVYYKWDSDGVTASGFLSISQGIFIGDLTHIIVKSIGRSHEFYHSPASKIEVGIMLCLLAINYFNYRKKYWVCRERWRGESLSFLKGVLVILALIAPLILGVLLIEIK